MLFTKKKNRVYILQFFAGQILTVPTRQGTWADGDLEKAFKAILTYQRQGGGDYSLVQHGNTHIKLFEALKKEFKALRVVWMARREVVITKFIE